MDSKSEVQVSSMSPSSEFFKSPSFEVKSPSSEVSSVATCSDKVSSSSNNSFESSVKRIDQVNEVKQVRCQGGGEVRRKKFKPSFKSKSL